MTTDDLQMSSGISYEDAINTLTSMFESWDRETLIEIFQGNEYHMERTIESILAMEGSVDSGGDVAQSRPPESSTTNTDTLIDYGYDNDIALPVPPLQPNNRNLENITNSRSEPNYRGVKCQLPDTFLRAPGYVNILADEQLAIMLQDEMFRKEVLSAMGPNGIPRRQTANPNNPLGPRANDPGDPLPDLGILKGIQEMGEGVKKQLTNLATRFQASRNGTNNRFTLNQDNSSGANPMTAEQVPLTQIYEEEEEFDSREVINFDNSPGTRRGGHALNDLDDPNRDRTRKTAAAAGGAYKDKNN